MHVDSEHMHGQADAGWGVDANMHKRAPWGKRCSLSKDGNGGKGRAPADGGRRDIVGKVMVVVVDKIWLPLCLKMTIKVGKIWRDGGGC